MKATIKISKMGFTWSPNEHKHTHLGEVLVDSQLKFCTSGTSEVDTKSQCLQWIRKKGLKYECPSV